MQTISNARLVYETAEFAAESTGDKATWAPKLPIRIVRWGILNKDTAIIDVGAGMVIALDKRPTIGSDTDRVEIDTLSTSTTDIAIAKGLYSDLASGFDGEDTTNVDNSITNVAPSDPANTVPYPVDVYPGEELVFEVTNAADTDADEIEGWIEYELLPFTPYGEAEQTNTVYTKVNS